MSTPTLREICERATRGPRSVEDPFQPDCFSVVGGNQSHEWLLIAACHIDDDIPTPEANANAQLIARLGPDTVLAVLDALESCIEWPDQETGARRTDFNEKLVETALNRLNGKRA